MKPNGEEQATRITSETKTEPEKKDLLDFFADMPLFCNKLTKGGIHSKLFNDICRGCRIATYKQGRPIFNQGENVQDVFYLKQGAVAMVVEQPMDLEETLQKQSHENNLKGLLS